AARTTARGLLHEHRVRHEVIAPAVLARELEPEIAALGQAGEDVVGEPAGLFPFPRMGEQLALDEAPDLRAQPLVFGCKWRNWPGRMRPGPARHMCRAAGRNMFRPGQLIQIPYERPMTSSMISSVPAPMRFSRRSRHTRSIPYSFM